MKTMMSGDTANDCTWIHDRASTVRTVAAAGYRRLSLLRIGAGNVTRGVTKLAVVATWTTDRPAAVGATCPRFEGSARTQERRHGG
jgi:hypothetical protein